MKKCLAVILTATLLLCAAPLAGFTAIDLPEWDFGELFLSAKAAEIVASGNCGAEGDGSNLTWTLDSEGVLTISGRGKMADRSWSLWSDETTLKAVVLQSGVTNIGGSAFCSCENLASITIPDSVTSIGDSAFSFCSSLTSIDIPNSVTSIGNNAFSECKSFKSVMIPDSVTDIGGAAFFECTKLASVVIPNNVMSIGFSAFYNTPWYNNQPDGMIYAGKVAYRYKGTMLNDTAIVLKSGTNGIASGAFRDCSGLVSVTIPVGVTNIGSEAFSGCINLMNVTIPKSVTSIGDSAFYDCANLADVTIPNSVKIIGMDAFKGCKSFKSVIIPDGVTSIGSGAFRECWDLENVTIPNSVTSIGGSAFYNTPWYNNQPDGLIYAGKVAYDYKGEMLNDTDIVLKNGTKSISSSAFSSCENLTGVTIPASVTEIGSYAFAHCTNLVSVTIPNSVTNIGYYAFADCKKLVGVTIGKGVTSIEYNAFSGCTSLASVIIPDRVTMIGARAFSGCSSLASVNIPNSVTNIGDAVFEGCKAIERLTIGKTIEQASFFNNIKIPKDSLKTVVITDGVTNIAEGIFSGCPNLVSVTIPNSVTNIGESAFYGCTGLVSVMIPNSVTNIGKNAFQGCTSLTAVTIPDSVTSIGENAFFGCTSVASVKIGDGVASIGSGAFAETIWDNNQPDGLVYAGKVAYRYIGTMQKDTTISIAEGTKGIGGNAFYDCAGLSNISIPDSVTNIGDFAFFGCSGLTSIMIPNSVTSIGDYAFHGCRGLSSVTIPNSVTSIGNWAFRYCDRLTAVTISDSVTNIGEGAFIDCPGLSILSIAAKNPVYISTENCIIEKDSKKLVAGCKNSVIPLDGSVTRIGDAAFYGCTGLTSVVIPESVTSIGDNAFFHCVNLTSVTIPNCVTNIGICAFSGCSKLEHLAVDTNNPVYFSVGNCIIEKESKSLVIGCNNSVIPVDGSVTSIERWAFRDCARLTDVTIPDSVTSIGEAAFSGCKTLTQVAIPKSVSSIENYAFENCAKLMSITIPDNVKSIASGVFSGCVALMRVTIPSSVTTIWGAAFSGCSNLRHICYTGTQEQWEAVQNYAGIIPSFYNCLLDDGIVYNDTKTMILTVYDPMISQVSIPDSVTDIGDSAFEFCLGLTSVSIPDGVMSIGNSAFSECTRLTSVSIPSSVTSIGVHAFYGCTSLSNITIPNGVTNIEYETFARCAGLMSVTIGNGVTSIGSSAFSHCTGLTAVTIPSGMTKIGNYAFYGCTGMTSIVIPVSVTEIGWGAIPESTVIFGTTGSYAQQWAEEYGRAFVPIGEATVMLNTLNAVNEPIVNAHGFANPGATVVCSVNGKETITVTASASCRWSAVIPLTDATDGNSVEIKASVTVDGKTAEKTATVTYQPDAITFREFTMNHRGYSITVKEDNLGVSFPNITYVPGYPLAFKIKVTNNDRIDKLYIVSNKDGESKQMELTYNEATGYWFVEGFFNEEDKNYVPGVFTIKGVDKDGKEFDAGVTIKINFLIDPSGYAYEAVTSNKLEGVTAAVYYKDAQGHELLWNAETADQLNPVTTLSDGAFAWVVPEGQWQVRLTKPGYLEARSQWMDVPPEYTDVYLGMAAEAAPWAAYVNVYADRAEITFSQYMDLNTVSTDNVKFDGYTGAIEPLDAVEQSEGSGNRYAKTFAFTPEKPFAGEIGVVIENVANYVGTPLASPYTASFTVAAEPKNLTATQDVSAVYGKTAEVTVSAENAAGKTVSVSCDSANVTLSDKTLTLDETGKATLSVTGEMPGIANLTFALDGTTLTAAAKASVTVPGVPAEPELPTDPESPATPTDPENPATPTDPENPATPTDPEGPDKPAYTLGDVDGDGEVSSGDARLALRASVQLEKYEKGSAAFLAADADKNGEIESSDARTILRVSVKLESFA